MESLQNAILQGQPADWFVMLIFLFIYLVLVACLLFFHLRTALHKDPPAGDPVPLSLILTFRNEEDNLRKYLEPLLAENRLGYEVVAVDNYSQDESASVLMALQSRFQALKVSSLKQDVNYSAKMAQNIALKAARHDWVNVITPTVNVSETNWLDQAALRLNNGSQVVVNYSNVKPERSFFNLLYRTELFFQQIKSYGFIKIGLPYVASQENMAFRKNLYFGEGGYRGKLSKPFANLELVINATLRKSKVTPVITSKTAFRREEQIRAKDFVELIRKDSVIRKHLPILTRFLLSLFGWANLLLLPVAGVVVVTVPETLPYIAGMLILLVFCNLLIIKKIRSRLQEYKLFLPSFLIALVLPYIKLIYRIRYHNYGERKEWKIGN